MGAGAYADVVAIAPINQIMAAFMTGQSMIRHFIGGKTPCRGQLLGDVEQRFGCILIRDSKSTPAMKLVVGRSGLDGQLVQRHVALLFIERPAKLPAPIRSGLARPCIDEIEGDAGKDASSKPKGGECFRNTVLAAETGEIPIIERLYTHRQTIDTCGAVALKVSCFGAGRIRFEGYLSI